MTIDELEQTAADWVTRCTDRDVSPDVLAAWEAWLAEDPRHEVAYCRMAFAYERIVEFLRAHPGALDKFSTQIVRH